jgi:hypothetical protein
MSRYLSLANGPHRTAVIFLNIPRGIPDFFLMIPLSFLVIPLAIPRIFSMFHSRSKSKAISSSCRVFSRFRSPTDTEIGSKHAKRETRSAHFFSSFHSPALPAVQSDRSTAQTANFCSGIVRKTSATSRFRSGMVRKTASGTWRNPGEWNTEKNRGKNLCSKKADLAEVLDACKSAPTVDLLPMCRGSGTMRKLTSKNGLSFLESSAGDGDDSTLKVPREWNPEKKTNNHYILCMYALH